MHPTAVDLLFSSDPAGDATIEYNADATTAQIKNSLETADSFSVRWDLKYSDPSTEYAENEDRVETSVRNIINAERAA